MLWTDWLEISVLITLSLRPMNVLAGIASILRIVIKDITKRTDEKSCREEAGKEHGASSAFPGHPLQEPARVWLSGSSPNPALLGLLWRLHYIGMVPEIKPLLISLTFSHPPQGLPVTLQVPAL